MGLGLGDYREVLFWSFKWGFKVRVRGDYFLNGLLYGMFIENLDICGKIGLEILV